MAHGTIRTLAVPLEALLSDDPDLYLVEGDMRAWSEAHPCECEALCLCDIEPCDCGAVWNENGYIRHAVGSHEDCEG